MFFGLQHTDSSLNLGLVIIPIVAVFVWVFNAYRLGRFQKPQPTEPEDVQRQQARQRSLSIGVSLFGAALCILLLILYSQGLL